MIAEQEQINDSLLQLIDRHGLGLNDIADVIAEQVVGAKESNNEHLRNTATQLERKFGAKMQSRDSTVDYNAKADDFGGYFLSFVMGFRLAENYDAIAMSLKALERAYDSRVNEESLSDRLSSISEQPPKEEDTSVANSYEANSKQPRTIWQFFNVIAIVTVSSLINLYFASDGSIPAWKFITAIPYLFTNPFFLADAAGTYVFALLLGLFGLLYKPRRGLGFIICSWAGLAFMTYASFIQYQ